MEGGRPHVLWGGEGSFFFFVTKDCFLRWCSCSLCSTHDLVKGRYQREGALWCGPLEGVCIQKHTFHAHFACPCLCGQLVVLFSSTRDFQSQGQHEWNSRDAVPLLPCVPTPHSTKPTSVPSPDLKSPLMPKAGCPLPPQGRTSWSPGGKQKDYVLMLVPDLFPLLQFM